MKTLIQNYTSSISTEPMYIERCLQECGEESQIWANPQLSAFDAFDSFNPDLFITHYSFLTSDIIKYLSNKQSITVALNITGITEADLQKLEELSQGVNLPLLFTNLFETNSVVSKKIKTISLYPAADIFLPTIPTPEFSIQKCIISVTENDMYEEKLKGVETYHKFSFNAESLGADMALDIASMRSFYPKYDEVLIADDVSFVTSQVLFDGILNAKKVSLQVPESQQETLDKILAELFVSNDDQDDKDISEVIKSQVKIKHNCFKRCARLFRSLKAEDVASKMEVISSKL